MRKVLIVDDETDIRDLISGFFELDGADVRVADSAKSAYEVLKNFKPDVILSDGLMPGVRGTEFLHQVKKSDPQILTILISAFDSFSEKELFEHDIDAFFSKPFRMESISRFIDRSLALPAEVRARKKLRITCRVGLIATVPHEQEFRTQSRNVSGEGIFVEWPFGLELPEAGSIIRLEFLEEGRDIDVIGEATAECRWVRKEKDAFGPRGCGLKFQHIDSQTQKLIENLVFSFSPSLAGLKQK